MDQKEQQLRDELAQLDEQLQDPSIYSDPAYPKIAKRKSAVESLVALFDTKAKLAADKASALELRSSSDPELKEMAETELSELEGKIATNEESLVESLT